MTKIKNDLDETKIMSHWLHSDKVYVSIICLCFEHESYIEQAIDSFLKQKTKYRFEIIIHDDKSNDNSVKILLNYKKKFPNIIKLKLQKENIYSKGGSVIKEAFSFASGDYIAFCEGDDWWFDEHKVEKQVDVLKASQYILTHSNCYLFNQQKRQFINESDNKKVADCSIDNLIQQKYIIRLASVMVEYSVLNETINLITNEFPKNMKLYDLPMWCILRDKGRFYFYPESLSVYRVLSESASHSKNMNKRLEFSRSVTDVMLRISLTVNLSIKSHLFIIRRIAGLLRFSVKLKNKDYILISIQYFFQSITNLATKGVSKK